jgi:hypothetical protein
MSLAEADSSLLVPRSCCKGADMDVTGSSKLVRDDMKLRIIAGTLGAREQVLRNFSGSGEVRPCQFEQVDAAEHRIDILAIGNSAA